MISLMIALLVAAPCAGAEQGLWRTADGSAHIELAPCGQKLCGTVRWIRNPPVRDLLNPNPALRGRSLVGVVVIQSVLRDGNRWTGGRLYEPRTGRSYPARLSLEGSDQLFVQGCRFGICRGERWTRIR